jgi:xanthine dehydrogenase YagT iron-sulfur-binding subunit
MREDEIRMTKCSLSPASNAGRDGDGPVIDSPAAKFTALARSAADARLACSWPEARRSSEDIKIRVLVNGDELALAVDPRTSLLDLIREKLRLTGAKKGCDHGQCGACTLHLDGRRIVSCLTPAVHADGREVVTIEGISPSNGDLHLMQQAFIDHDALQCGYCTPGQIMAAIACFREGHANSPEEIREYMSGNICRCGAYVGIVAAIQSAAAKMRKT